MPPDTAWEWLEAYGPLSLAPERAHGEWHAAQAAAESWLGDNLPENVLDTLLSETKPDALTPVDPAVCGRGWGTLDNLLRAAQGRKAISAHLDLGALDEGQRLWQRFLETGTLDEPDPSAVPTSFMVQDEWFRLLKAAVRGRDQKNWFAWYQAGLGYYARALYEEAADAFTASLNCRASSHAHHGLGNALRMTGKPLEAAAQLHAALKLDVACVPLAREALRFCYDAGDFARMSEVVAMLPAAMQAVPMIRALTAVSFAHCGRNEEARALMLENGGLTPPDLREGDNFLPTEYVYNELALAKARGETLLPAQVPIPAALDYRMFAASEGQTPEEPAR